MSPSAVARSARLAATARPFFRRISLAFWRSPFACSRAFLQSSIRGAVSWGNFLTAAGETGTVISLFAIGVRWVDRRPGFRFGAYLGRSLAPQRNRPLFPVGRIRWEPLVEARPALEAPRWRWGLRRWGRTRSLPPAPVYRNRGGLVRGGDVAGFLVIGGLSL